MMAHKVRLHHQDTFGLAAGCSNLQMLISGSYPETKPPFITERFKASTQVKGSQGG